MLDYMRSLPREVTFKEEVSSYQFWKSIRTEFLCSTLYTLIGVGSLMHYESLPPVELSKNEPGLVLVELKASFVFGALVASLMFISSGHIRGHGSCHLSPSLTFASFLVRELSLFKFVLLTAAQSLGSLLATAVLYGLTFYDVASRPGLGALVPLRGLPPSNLFGFEFIGSFLIVLTYLKVTDERAVGTETMADTVELSETNGLQRVSNAAGGAAPGTASNLRNISSSSASSSSAASNSSVSQLAFLYVGLATAAAHLFSFRYSGSGLNPARSLASAVFSNIWTDQWVYWVGPLLGGAFAGFTYEYVKSSKLKTSGQGSSHQRTDNGGRDHVMTVRREVDSELTTPFETEATSASDFGRF